MQRQIEATDSGHSPHRHAAAVPDASLPKNAAQFRALLRENSERSACSLLGCLGLARWTLAAATSLIDSEDLAEAAAAENSPENEQLRALLEAAELLRSRVQQRCKARPNGRLSDDGWHEDGGGEALRGCEGEGAKEKADGSAVARTLRKRSEQQAAGEKEAVHALLDFGRRVSAEESLQTHHHARPETCSVHDNGAERESGDLSAPAIKKPRQHRKVSLDSNYEPYSIPMYMPMHNVVCDPLLSGPTQSLPYQCYMHHPGEELMMYTRPTQHPFAGPSYSSVPFGLSPQHLSPRHAPAHPPPPPPTIHAAAAAAATSPPVPPFPAAAALSPPVYMPMISVADTRPETTVVATLAPPLPPPPEAAHPTAGPQHATSSAQESALSSIRPGAKRKRLRFPEQWTENRPVHGSRYVYEGRSCRLQWEQDGKTFGFEVYEQLRCKFFDGRFSIITTGDIIQLQDSRIYVLLATARDVVPRNHQYDTWMICYNFAGYRGMEVVFVELKWLQSVLTEKDELPPDHPGVNLSQLEDVLERFTEQPAFHRRHSVAGTRFRTSNGRHHHRGRSGSKTSDEDDGQD